MTSQQGCAGTGEGTVVSLTTLSLAGSLELIGMSPRCCLPAPITGAAGMEERGADWMPVFFFQFWCRSPYRSPYSTYIAVMPVTTTLYLSSLQRSVTA